MVKEEKYVVSSGRKRRKAEEEGIKPFGKLISDSLLFTLGLAFVIVYFTGILLTAGGESYDGSKSDAVEVFAGIESSGEKRGIWDSFEDLLREAFKE